MDRVFTTEKCVEAFKDAPINFDISWIPKVPEISFYDNKGDLLCKSNEENIFYGVEYWIVKNNLKGYYCTVETEWWDENNEYQGNGKERNYKRFHFNVNKEHMMDSIPCNIFQFPFETIMKIKNER